MPSVSPGLRLQRADEVSVLPVFPSVSSLMSDSVMRGRCELLPAAGRRASEWHPGAIGPRGGVEPTLWDPDPIPPFRAVELFRVRDAFYVPSYGVVISSGGEVLKRSFAEAAYVTPDFLALPHVRRLADDTFLDLADARVETLDRAAVTLPWGGLQNYAHFLLDCVTGGALIRERVELGGYPLVFPPLRGWQRRHLELAELEPRELGDPIYRVADLVFTNCMGHFLHGPNLNYRALRERQLRNHRSAHAASRHLYISRKGRDYRRFLSEDLLEDRLRAAGFEVVLPEEHTVDEQIRLFHEAAVVVGCTGAGFANVLYCRPDTRVVEIKTPRTDGRWVAWLCVLLGCRWRPYFCDIDAAPGADGSFSFDADLEDLLRFVEASSV